MNNFDKYFLALLCLLLATATGYAQVTAPNNLPSTTNYVGFNANSFDPLPIRNDGDPRIYLSSNLRRKISINELPTWNGLNGMSEDDVQRTTMGLHNEPYKAWSLLHLWSGYLNPGKRRIEPYWRHFADLQGFEIG